MTPIDTKIALSTLSGQGYLCLYGTREESPTRLPITLAIVMIANESEYSLTLQRFKMLCSYIARPTDNRTLNVVFCAANSLTTHIGKEIERMKNEGMENISAKRLRVEYYMHEQFALDATQHHMVDPHRIMSQTEVVAFCKRYSTKVAKFPIISIDDMQVIFLGAVPGQCIEITQLSDTAGESVPIRRVV